MFLKVLFFIVHFGQFNIWAFDTLDINVSKKEKECFGTWMGFSFSGTHEYHYESMRRRYTGCTYVHGNLEVTNLNNGNMTYDLSFLSTIKVVTGYVLLGLLNVETVPLTSLRLIRADNTLKLGSDYHALVVALTSEETSSSDNPNPGLKELQMPSLKEITRGKIIFTQNPSLCYVDTIAWDMITDSEVIMKDTFHNEHCGTCPLHCSDSDGISHCWGKGPGMCQKVQRIECDEICYPGRCHSEGILGCCHPQCAAGCTGGLDTQCEVCKYFRYGHRCVSECPKSTYPLAQECIDF